MTNSLSFVFGIIANELIELNIPHNLLISEDGNIIYIFLRDFCSPNNHYGWIEHCGAVVVTDEKDFDIKEADIIAKKKSLTIEKNSVDLLKSNIKKHLSQFI